MACASLGLDNAIFCAEAEKRPYGSFSFHLDQLGTAAGGGRLPRNAPWFFGVRWHEIHDIIFVISVSVPHIADVIVDIVKCGLACARISIGCGVGQVPRVPLHKYLIFLIIDISGVAVTHVLFFVPTALAQVVPLVARRQ